MITGENFLILKFTNSYLKTCIWSETNFQVFCSKLQIAVKEIFIMEVFAACKQIVSQDNLKIKQRSHYNLLNSVFKADLLQKVSRKNPEFRNNPEHLRPQSIFIFYYLTDIFAMIEFFLSQGNNFLTLVCCLCTLNMSKTYSGEYFKL